MLTLYHNDMSVCAQKVRLCLAEKGVAVRGAASQSARRRSAAAGLSGSLNPKGVVPTLVDDDTVVVESVVINEYIDDAFPKRPLKPNDPAGRAKMRWWTKQIDDGIFGATGTVSMSIAFHHQYTPEAVLDELIRQRGPAYRARFCVAAKGRRQSEFSRRDQAALQDGDRYERGTRARPVAIGRATDAGRYCLCALHHAARPSEILGPDRWANWRHRRLRTSG